MQEYRESAIITVDDDVIYPRDTVESLIKNFEKYPRCISARRVHRITHDISNNVLSYNLWEFECSTIKKPSFDLIAIGVGGVLYPPHILNGEKNISTPQIFVKTPSMPTISGLNSVK